MGNSSKSDNSSEKGSCTAQMLEILCSDDTEGGSKRELTGFDIGAFALQGRSREFSPEFLVDFEDFVESLPPLNRKIVERRLQGYTYAEIEKDLGCSWLKVHQTVRILRAYFKEDE